MVSLFKVPQTELAQLLVEQLPARLNSVYYVNSGSEAVEGGIKLAKRATGRYEIIACRTAYHGSTHMTLALQSEPQFKDAFAPLTPGIDFIDHGMVDELDKITEKTAAVIVETVQGEAGIRTAEESWFKSLRKRCDETGALLILDEIQAGMGRTGKLFAYEHYGIEPDILLLAKAFGAGLPLGAFISSQELMKEISYEPVLGHITTFGGNPVAAAAAKAGLEELLMHDWTGEVQAKGKRFREKLDHPAIKEIRGIGLMMAMELDSFDSVQQVIKGCMEEGLITDWFLFCDNAIRIAPPLIITDEEIERACDILLEQVNKL